MKSNLFKITIIFALLNFHFLVFDANAQSNGTPAIMTDGSKLSGSWRKPEELIAKSDDGSQDFVGNGLTETIHNKTSLTKEEAASMAKAYLAQVFPEFSQRLSLKNVNQQISGVLPKTGAAVAWPSGYLVQFSVVKDGVPIWDNYVNVRIAADQVERVNFQVYNQTQEEGAGTIQPLGADASLTKALPAIKNALGIQSKYELLSMELVYVNRAVIQGNPTDFSENFVPAWHLLINPSYQNEYARKHVADVWLDASTGAVLGTKQN